MADYALTLSDITGRGLGPASLALLPGEIAGLVGPAGAGKTRLLQVAAGALKPRTGEGRVWGVRVTHPAVLSTARDRGAGGRLAGGVVVGGEGGFVGGGPLPTLRGGRTRGVILEARPAEPPPGFRVTAAGLEASLTGRTVEAALALCRAHRLPVRASRVRVKSLEEVVLETHDAH